MCRQVRIGATPAAGEMLGRFVYSSGQFSFQMCLESGDGSRTFRKRRGDRDFQTAGAMMLNTLDWKLILAVSRVCS